MPNVAGRTADVPPGRSARRAERGMALVAAGMRAVLLIQIGLGFVAGIRVTSDPLAYAVLTAAVVAVSLVLIIQCLTFASARSGWWQLPDLTLAWIAFPALTMLLPRAELTGTWSAWAAALAVNVAALSGAWLRPSLAMANGFALAGWGFAWVGLPTDDWVARISDALTIPAYAIVVSLLARYLRALSRDADQSREDAVAATQALELQRYQLTVHDASSVLRQLSDEQTPAEVLPGLRRQGHREANRLRRYLGAGITRSADGTVHTVGSMISAAVVGFDDLPIEPAVELGAHVVLPEHVWVATSRAVATVLHNVRLHAQASQVVVHADTDEDSWEVVVSDDGIGFDPLTQPFGFGLKTQVQDALEELGMSVSVVSAPGRGTSVTIVGPTTP